MPIKDLSPREWDVRALGADPFGTKNSLPIFRDVLQDIKSTQLPGTVRLRRGSYLFVGSTNVGGVPNVSGIDYQLPFESDGIKFIFEEGAEIVSNEQHADVFFICGANKPAGASLYDQYEYRDSPSYPLTGVSLKGSDFVTCANPADAGNFTVDDWVQIATGQTVNGSNEPDSETNQVLSSNSGTGVVLFRKNLSSTYQQENYNAGSSGISSVGGAGTAAPYVIRKVNDRILHNIELVNPRFRLTNTRQAISLWYAENVCIRRPRLGHNYLGMGCRDAWQVYIEDFASNHKSDGVLPAYALGPSTGCGDWYVNGMSVKSDRASFLHLHEGLKNSRFANGRIRAIDDPGTNPLIDIVGRAQDLVVTDFNVFTNPSADTNAVSVDALSGGDDCGNELRNINVYSSGGAAGTKTAGIIINAGGWRGYDTCEIRGRTKESANGRLSLRGLQNDHGHDVASRCMVAYLTPAHPTVRFDRKLFRGAIVTDVHVRVRTAFNSGLTGQITIGYDDWSSNPTAIMTAISVLTAGIKSTAAAHGALWDIPDETNSHDIKIFYTETGTPANAGEVHVIVFYCQGARRD